MDTKLTPFLLERPQLLGYGPIFLQLCFWQSHIFSTQHIGTLESCVIAIFCHICVSDLGFTLMSQLQGLKISHDSYYLCVCIQAKVEFYTS